MGLTPFEQRIPRVCLGKVKGGYCGLQLGEVAAQCGESVYLQRVIRAPLCGIARGRGELILKTSHLLRRCCCDAANAGQRRFATLHPLVQQSRVVQ